MKIGLKFFALCLAAALIGAANAQQKMPEAWEVVKNASIYACMVHGYTQAHTVSDLIRYGARDKVSIVADSREYVEDFINAGYDVWTSDDGTNTMRYIKSQIVVDDKYIIDAQGKVTLAPQAAYLLSNDLVRFCDTRAKKQYPKKKSKPTR